MLPRFGRRSDGGLESPLILPANALTALQEDQ